MNQEPSTGQLWGIVLAAGEGTRVRPFLSQLCGGRGIKQFCAVIGRRSMLKHTLVCGQSFLRHVRTMGDHVTRPSRARGRLERLGQRRAHYDYGRRVGQESRDLGAPQPSTTLGEPEGAADVSSARS